MAKKIIVVAPDFGADSASIIEILVTKGDKISLDDSIITLESDKATVEVPSPNDGIVEEIKVKVGDKLKIGQEILILRVDKSVKESEKSPPNQEKSTTDKAQKAPENKNSTTDKNADYDYDICVIGGGPGGYTAAFRAADLGLKALIVERYDVLGGVCLNVGCIPSKALLHIANVIEEAKHSSEAGVTFGEAKIDLKALHTHKKSITDELNQGLAKIATGRGVEIMQGIAHFKDEHTLTIKQQKGNQLVSFKSAIIAVGSRVTKLPFIPEDKNIWDSTDALELRKIPKTMMILGGGIIGLEMATVYKALGTKITVVELGPQLIPEADKDMVIPLMKKIKGEYENIYTNTKATALKPTQKEIEVTLEGSKAPKKETFEVVLVAVGRLPNGGQIKAENANVKVEENGFISVNEKQQTNVEHIYAIGDVTGQPMLAHKATHQAKVAAEVIHGEPVSFSPMTIPSVAYTHPEVAWMGKTEKQLKAENISYDKGLFPWQASGRALSSNGRNGISKAMFCKETGRLLGAAVTGPNAGELISEAVLAMEMGADAKDISLTIHPHPTLAETFAMTAEVVDGSITDIPQRR